MQKTQNTNQHNSQEQDFEDSETYSRQDVQTESDLSQDTQASDDIAKDFDDDIVKKNENVADDVIDDITGESIGESIGAGEEPDIVEHEEQKPSSGIQLSSRQPIEPLQEDFVEEEAFRQETEPVSSEAPEQVLSEGENPQEKSQDVPHDIQEAEDQTKKTESDAEQIQAEVPERNLSKEDKKAPVVTLPEIIQHKVYVLRKPQIVNTNVYSLYKPEIISTKVEYDDLNLISKKLLILSLENSSNDEISYIAKRYNTNGTSSQQLLSSMGISSSDVSRIKAKSSNKPTSGSSFSPEDTNSANKSETQQAQDSEENANIRNLVSSTGADLEKDDLFDKSGKDRKNMSGSRSSNSEETVSSSQAAESSYDFNISHADEVELYELNERNFIRLDGNVQISFKLSDQQRVLKADSILYDIDEAEIVASGKISISSQSSGSQDLQDIVGEYLTINLKDNKVVLVNAVGKTEKSNQNVNSSYYMSGEKLVLDNVTGEMYFDKGSLMPSFSKNTSNWSISADKIMMKNNGDVILSGLSLHIGRVPILPKLPFIFLLPGTALSINPAIGFSSAKGAFINLTYELYGQYPQLGKTGGGEGNSLTNLLKSDASGTMKKDGILYTFDSSDTRTPVKRNSDYIATFLDFYSDYGVFLGMESKNHLFNVLNIAVSAGMAYRPHESASPAMSSTYRNFRYFFDITDLSTSFSDLKVSAKIPIYSDPDVGYDYQNRLTGFSIDSLFMTSPEFPSTAARSVSERKYNISLSYSKNFNFKVISSLTSRLNLEYSRYWTLGESDDYYSYASGEFTLPSGSVNLSGTIFSFTNNNTSSSSIKQSIDLNAQGLDESERREQELLVTREKIKFINVKKVDSIKTKVEKADVYDSARSENDNTVEDSAEVFADRLDYRHNSEENEKTSDPDEKTTQKSNVQNRKSTAYDIYDTQASLGNTQTSERSFFTGSFITLKYSIAETFSNIFQKPIDIKKFLGPRKTSNSISGTATLQGGIGNNIFTFSEVLTPNYQYSFTESSANLLTHEFTLRSNFSSSLSIPLSLPNININYSMSSVLMTYKSTDDDINEKNIIQKKIGWDSESISSHKVGLSMAFKPYVMASVDTSLPPMKSYTVTPTLSFSYSGLSISGSHSLNGTDFESLKSSKTSGKISYSKTPYSISLSIDYDYSKESADDDNFFRPFSLSQNASATFFSSWLSISESLSFNGLSSSGQSNYFQQILLRAAVKSYAAVAFTLSGAYDSIDLTKTTFSLNVPDFNITFWKNRIVLTLGFKASANLDFRDAFQNTLSYSFNFEFNIREFIKISLSLEGANNNFMRYTGNERFGRFNFGDFFLDILRGINVFSPDMANSNFKMERLSARLEHDMGDFIFNFTFTGKFELNVNEYTWKPEYSILLKWRVIPELKVDKSVSP